MWNIWNLLRVIHMDCISRTLWSTEYDSKSSGHTWRYLYGLIIFFNFGKWSECLCCHFVSFIMNSVLFTDSQSHSSQLRPIMTRLLRSSVTSFVPCHSWNRALWYFIFPCHPGGQDPRGPDGLHLTRPRSPSWPEPNTPTVSVRCSPLGFINHSTNRTQSLPTSARQFYLLKRSI